MVANHALAGARALRRAAVVVLALLVTTLVLLPVAVANARGSRVDGTEAAAVHYINAYRNAHGLRSVRISGRMSVGADAHSHYMARHRYATHGAWAARVSRYSHSSTIGEIIGWLSASRGQAREIVHLWMNSSPHRAVILNGAYRRVGVARRRSGHEYFYTIDFAR